jgi:hypothetical protein
MRQLSACKLQNAQQQSLMIERIKTDLKTFEFGLIRFYPLHPLFPCSNKVLFGSGSSGLGYSPLSSKTPLIKSPKIPYQMLHLQ